MMREAPAVALMELRRVRRKERTSIPGEVNSSGMNVSTPQTGEKLF